MNSTLSALLPGETASASTETVTVPLPEPGAVTGIVHVLFPASVSVPFAAPADTLTSASVKSVTTLSNVNVTVAMPPAVTLCGFTVISKTASEGGGGGNASVLTVSDAGVPRPAELTPATSIVYSVSGDKSSNVCVRSKPVSIQAPPSIRIS